MDIVDGALVLMGLVALLKLVRALRIEHEWLPKALENIAAAMDSTNEQVAFTAAKWIAEMILGKPRQPIDADATASEIALALATTLRRVLEDNRPIPLDNPESAIMEGTHVLGPPAVEVDYTVSPPATKSAVTQEAADSFPG